MTIQQIYTHYENICSHHLTMCEQIFLLSQTRGKNRAIKKTFNYHFKKAQAADRRATFYFSQLKKQKAQ